MKAGVIEQPINFLGAGLTGIFILQVLHLYPIIYLNMSASLENIEASCIESAENIGASFWQTLRKIILPMSLPGYFAGAFLVFIWSLTDLGTPLVFDYSDLIPVSIFQSLTDIYSNPGGYVLVIFVCIIAIILFFSTQYFLEKISYVGIVRYKTTKEPLSVGKPLRAISLIYLGILLFISILPHAAVILNSFSEKWFLTVLPERWTLHYYREVFHHPIAKISLINSTLYSGIAGIITTIISLAIGFIIYRTQIKGRQILESFVIFPMAIPGIVFAFAFVLVFSETILDPRNFPVFLLVIAYVLRRMPFSARSIMANFQQIDISCEEACLNLGASRWTTFRKITMPVLKNGIVAGFIFAFAFSMMEVSSSLILVSKQQYFPIAKGIYQLAGRVTDGPYIASALGVLGMIVSFIALMMIYKLTGQENVSISV
jgi:iron(III) transport system permease protein